MESPTRALQIDLLVCRHREEQDAIVRFLDHANRRIERYIRAKKKLIALLNEQKQAIIHRAVTRGLDPTFVSNPPASPGSATFRSIGERLPLSASQSVELIHLLMEIGLKPHL